jgi:hypothetical protein
MHDMLGLKVCEDGRRKTNEEEFRLSSTTFDHLSVESGHMSFAG